MAAIEPEEESVELEDARSEEIEVEGKSDLAALVSAKAILVYYAIFQVLPFAIAISSSTMTRSQYLSYPPRLLPGGHLIENYSHVLFQTNFLETVLNQLIYAVGSTIGIVVLGTLAGYALAKYEFRGKRSVMLVILVFLAIPFQLLAIPLFKLLADIGWANTFHGAILAAVTAPIGVLFMKQNIEQAIDDNLLRSARVDGASELRIFRYIVFPLLIPGIIALASYQFLIKMKAFFWPLIILRTEEVQPFTVWLANLRGAAAQPDPYGVIFPAGIMVGLGMLAIFLYGQKYFIQGLTGGSIKG